VCCSRPERRAEAEWLPPDERDWLVSRLAQEAATREAARRYSVMEALGDPKVLALSLVYFGATATNYGLSFFLPQIVKAFGVSNIQAGGVAALPYVVGGGAALLGGGHPGLEAGRRVSCAVPAGVRALRPSA